MTPLRLRYKATLEYALGKGAVVVAAAGNNANDVDAGGLRMRSAVGPGAGDP